MSIRKGIGHTLKFGNGWSGKSVRQQLTVDMWVLSREGLSWLQTQPFWSKRQTGHMVEMAALGNYRLTLLNITPVACQATFC